MPLGKYNGRASFAVIVMCKFLRSYFHELKSNIVVQQSEVLLDFLELTCPIKAVEHNHISQLSRLLQMSVDFNKHDSDGFTALHRAVKLDRIEAVKWLSNCSTVHINSKDNNGNSPLMLAIELNKIETANILIEAGAEVKLKNNVRSTPLHIAANKGQINLCKLLLEKGVKIDELNMKRKTPLHYAIHNRFEELAFLLLKEGASTEYEDKFGNTLVSLATGSRLPKLLKYLLDTTSIDVNAFGRFQATALHIATASGCIETTNYLLEKGANPLLKDCKEQDCLFSSVYFSTPEIFKILCNHCKEKKILDLEKELNGSRLIHYAAKSPKGNEIITILHDFGANINARVI